MKIKKIPVGILETNCYIISEESECFVIDPGDDVEKIVKEIGILKIKYIILTHLHFDHIIAVSKLKSISGAKVLCHKEDLEILDENLLQKNDIDKFINEGSILEIENCKLKIIFTPGHTPGSICLYNPEQKVLFSGDSIFAGSIGVTHFKGGDFAKIKISIKEKLLTLPDDTHVYPGHGPDFELGDYKKEIESLLK
ncbi:MAG TPA: MBL fold metallo-hydrolase [Patescibacteria group bacterium]|nr:MBL fold metallo-hydrolase [Patescibacteria group bacterium]